jgi:hypothetical protein
MMSDFFEYHPNKENYFNLLDKEELELLIRNSPEGAITLVDAEADPNNHIFSLGEHILIREQIWNNHSK